MVTKFSFYLIILLLFCLGCNPQESSVDIKTNGIFRPITFGLDGQNFSGTLIDKDEWVTSDGPMEMVVTVTNNSLFPYTDIDLSFSPVNNESTALRFKPLASGETTFPGLGGTCTDILIAGTSCTIIIELAPPIDRLYIEQAQLSFKNYVDYEQHVGQIKVLTGTPAELIIVEKPSRIRFGCDDDTSVSEGGRCVRSEGLTERTIERTYTQELKIKNVGGLKARKIQIAKSEKVENVDGQDECGTFCNAWTREDVDCTNGQNLQPQEECTFRFSFTPQNRIEAIDRIYERIKYFHTTSIQYEKDPKKRLAAVSMNFETLSSKIEGRLAGPGTLNLLGSGGTIQGNRISKQYRISNEGYNNARLKELRVKYTSCGSNNNESNDPNLQSQVQYDQWAVCKLEDSSNIFTCTNPNNDTLNLASLPFTLQDETGCFKKNKLFAPDCSVSTEVGSNDKLPLIPISCGCTLRVTFQPSMTVPFIIPPPSDCQTDTNGKFTDSDYDVPGKTIRIYPIYDSRWKNGEDHCENNNDTNCQPLPNTSYIKDQFNFKPVVQRKSAARLIIESFKYDDVTKSLMSTPPPISNLFNNYSFYDLGRLSVLSASQKSRPSAFRKLEITIRNRGSAFALLDKITYQIAGTTYEIKTNGTTVSTLKDANNCSGNNCYYRNAQTTNDCSIIPENGTCTLIMYMAPFRLLTDEAELLAMFDSDSNGLISPKVKSFNFIYRNGYTYADNERDYTLNPVGAVSYSTTLQFTAVLTKSAKLEEFADVEYGPNASKNPATISGMTRGDNFTYKLYIRNVGSKRAGKINFTVQSGYAFANSQYDCTPPNPNADPPPEPRDCRCFNTTNPSTYQPDIYNGNICSENINEFFESDEVCQIPIRWNVAPSDYLNELLDSVRTAGATNKLVTSSANPTNEFSNDLQRVPYKIFLNSPSAFDLNTRLSYRDCYQLTLTEFNSNFSSSTPTANGYDTHFGYTTSVKEFTSKIQNVFVPSRIVPVLLTQLNPKNFPWHTAFIYREAITSPNSFSNRLFYDTGSAKSINADVTYNRSSSPKTPYFDSTDEANMMVSILHSYKYSPNLGLSTLGTDEIRYRIFMGYHYRFALTNQTKFVFPFELTNLGTKDAKILSITDDGNPNLTLYRMNGTSRVGAFNSLALPLNITATNLRLEAEVNPSLCLTDSCLYKKEFEITYETGKQTRELDLGVTYTKCSNGITSAEAFCEVKTVKFVVYGVIDSTSTVPLDIAHKTITVQPDANGIMQESCPDNDYNEYTEANGTWNQNSGGTSISPSLQALRLQNVTPTMLNNTSQREKLAYTKRVIRITNTQGAGSILRIKKLFLRTSNDTPIPMTTNLGTAGALSIDEFIDNSRTNCDDIGIISSNRCQEGTQLPNGESCITVLRFRPTLSFNQTYSLSYLLTNVSNDSIPDDPHFIYNVPVSFQSIDPATLVASGTGVSSQKPKHRASLFLDPPQVPNNTGAISDLPQGFEVVLANVQTATPYVYGGTTTPVVEREINITNQRNTLASFLIQWRLFKDGNNYLTSTRLPVEGDFDANGFTQIAENPLGYIKAFAKKGCFAGSENIAHMSTGGFANTDSNCKIKLQIKLDHNNMLFTSNRGNADSVNPYMLKLKFYSAFRSQVSDIYIYAWFRVRPKEFIGTGLGWGTPTSSWPTGTNLNPIGVADDSQTTFGKIVGYRIFRTRLASLSNDSEDNFPLITYNATTQVGTIQDTTNILKKDYYFNNRDGTSDANCDNNGCLFPGSTGQERRFYYYRLALIREHASFSNGKQFFGLQKNTQFITNITIVPQAKILLPPSGFTYSHSNKLMLLNTLSTSRLSYNAASTFCTNTTVSLLDDVNTRSLARLLLTETVHSLTGSSLTQPIWLGSPINYTFTDVGCNFATNAINEATNTCVRYVPTATTGKKIINLPGYSTPAYAEPTNTALGFAMCFVDLKNWMP